MALRNERSENFSLEVNGGGQRQRQSSERVEDRSRRKRQKTCRYEMALDRRSFREKSVVSPSGVWNKPMDYDCEESLMLDV